jgi:DNA-directed RNA polymerase specialized sigma24 family protein
MRDSGLSYEKLAVQFGTSKWTVADTIARRRKKMREAA